MSDLATGWVEARLDAIAEVRLGRQRSPKNHQGDQMRPYLRAANVGWSGLLLDDVKMMNFTDAELAIYRLEPGDIVLGEASGSPGEVGKPALWSGEIADCCLQNTLIRVRPHGIEPKFLLHFLRYEARRGAFAEGARGVGIYHIGSAKLAAWQIPTPPMREQRRIAEVLDLVDGLRAKRRKAIALLDDLAQSIFLDMFGDPLDGSRGWPRRPLHEILDRIESGKSPKCLGRPALSGEWGVLKLGAVTSCEYRPEENKALLPGDTPDQRHEVKFGDLLFSRKNTLDLVAACVLVKDAPERLLLPDLIFRLVVNESAAVEKSYLHRLLIYPTQRKAVQALAGGSASSMSNISKSRLMDLRIPIPPKDLQVQFSRRIESVALQRKAHASALLELDELFDSVQQRAFRGDLWDH